MRPALTTPPLPPSHPCPSLLRAFVLRAPPSLGTARALRSRWLSKGNPDPDGFHLEIVAAVARLYMHADKRASPLTAAFEDKGLGEPDFALFCALRHAPLTQPLPPRPPCWLCVRACW